MIGRRAIVGLSLLCALLFCAFAASSASAVGTTAVTCVETKVKEGDFTDAHCGNQVKTGEGLFAHAAIEVGTITKISLSNEKTAESTKAAQPFDFAGTLSGVKVEFSCTTVKGAGTLTNEEPEAKVMRTTGDAVIEASKCTVKQPAKCTVKEPFTWDTHFKTYEKGTEMGIEFTPKNGKQFGSWEMQGSECALKGTAFAIEGSFKGTLGGTTEGKGATWGFTAASTAGLKWGGNPYTLVGSVTPRMTEGNPITFTT
jgi:hypothetical protein